MAVNQKSKKFVGRKASEEQKSYLLWCLEKDPSYFLDGDMKARQKSELWNKLACELNALGGAQKSGSKWLKYWSDQRSYVRERAAELHKKVPGTIVSLGADYYDPTSRVRILSDYEKRVLALVTQPEAPEKYLLEIEPLTVEKVEEESAQKRRDSIINEDEEESSESFTKRIKIEWDSDDSNCSQPQYVRKPSQSEQIEDGPPPEKITEVIIKSEFNIEPCTSPVPTTSPELSYTSTRKLPTKPPETNNKSGSKNDSSATIPKLINVPPKPSNNTPKTKKIMEFSTPIQMDGVTYICGTCKSVPPNKSNKNVEYKTLAIMEEAEKFNREIELKKLQVEEKKLEALNKLINVVQSGFDRMAHLANL